MEPNGEDYDGVADKRNVKAQARGKGKCMGMVKKSYNVKAVKKIMYAKEKRDNQRYGSYKATEEEKERAREEKEWADPISDKHSQKMKEKSLKAEEKVRRKLEKLQLYKAEMINGHKK